MAIKVSDSFYEMIGIFDAIRNVLAHDKIVPRSEHVIGDFEVKTELLVGQDNVIGFVYCEDAINSRLG